MLVGDVADDLFENILERDKAHDHAIFVDDEGEMRLAFPERLELGPRKGVVSGTNQGSSAMLSTSGAARRPPRRAPASGSLACSTPMMFSGSPRQSGSRE